eukprot:COSAG05_NODE_402_length_10229_cov_3.609674_1_plen_68_part_00
MPVVEARASTGITVRFTPAADSQFASDPIPDIMAVPQIPDQFVHACYYSRVTFFIPLAGKILGQQVV